METSKIKIPKISTSGLQCKDFGRKVLKLLRGFGNFKKVFDIDKNLFNNFLAVFIPNDF